MEESLLLKAGPTVKQLK